jgi:hypothetical protein
METSTEEMVCNWANRTKKQKDDLLQFFRALGKKSIKSQVWWYVPVIPALRRLRQEDMSSRSAWATKQGPVSKKKKKRNLAGHGGADLSSHYTGA